MSVLIALVVFVVVVSFVSGWRQAARHKSITRSVTASPGVVSMLGFYKYKRRDFFSGAELRFLKVLEMALSGRYRVFAKVRLCDLVEGSSRFSLFSHFRHISQRHVDFILCDLNSFSVVCAVELDDRSHLERRDKDNALNEVFATAGIPLLRFPVQSFYDIPDVKKRFDFILQKNA